MKWKLDDGVANTALGRSNEPAMAAVVWRNSRRLVMVAPWEKAHREDADGGGGVRAVGACSKTSGTLIVFNPLFEAVTRRLPSSTVKNEVHCNLLVCWAEKLEGLVCCDRPCLIQVFFNIFQ